VLADRIALDFEGTYWAPLQFPTFRSAIADFWSLTGQAPWVSFNLVDEWEYTAEFYTGLLQTTRSEGISGFDLHTALSTSGDLAPAFTESSWEKLAQVIPEPQGWMTVSAGIAALGLLHRARKSVPRA